MQALGSVLKPSQAVWPFQQGEFGPLSQACQLHHDISQSSSSSPKSEIFMCQCDSGMTIKWLKQFQGVQSQHYEHFWVLELLLGWTRIEVKVENSWILVIPGICWSTKPDKQIALTTSLKLHSWAIHWNFEQGVNSPKHWFLIKQKYPLT